MKVQQIELDQIVEDPQQPRKHHSEESLRGLADSIRQHGLLHPITVSPLSGSNGYRIVTGERRWRAAQMASLNAIPCVVKEVRDDERLTEQLIENLQREDLQPLEKARAIQHIKDSLNLTSREISRRLGLSERALGYLLDLLALPEEIGQAVVSRPNRPADGNVTEKHARFLKQLNDEPELQEAVVSRIREDRLSTDETENLVRALKKSPDRAKDILESPTDHLARFFQDSPVMTGISLEDAPFDEEPARLSARAQQILEFLPTLSDIDPDRLFPPELRQIEDALTSLQRDVERLLRRCKERLEEKV